MTANIYAVGQNRGNHGGPVALWLEVPVLPAHRSHQSAVVGILARMSAWALEPLSRHAKLHF